MAEAAARTPFPSSAIPFAFFVSLIRVIGAIPPQTVFRNVAASSASDAPPPALRTFRNWIAELHRRCAYVPPGTTAVVFRLLFPEEDARRKYSIKEKRLSQFLADILAVSTLPNGRGERLLKWKSTNASGCLGDEVQNVMNASATITESSLSIVEVDERLTDLAMVCAYSAPVIRQNTTGSPNAARLEVLRALYSALSPEEASVVTQIILKDLRPLLYPISEGRTHYTAALLNYNSHAELKMSKWDAMKAWDPSGRMLAAYRVRACLDEAALMFEHVNADDEGMELFKPQIGVPIQIPKCVKGKGCAEALQVLRNSEKVWAETKYDGERAQIHVEFESDGAVDVPRITIFSKSGRDSTLDRAAVHSIIRESLGLPYPEEESLNVPAGLGKHSKVEKNIILEAEMVAFSDRLTRIDEFWRIRSLIASTAIGVRHARASATRPDDEDDSNSQSSLISNGSDGDTRHLALVFFDVLLLNDMPLLSAPYSARRSLLESVVRVVHGRAMLAERLPIALPLSPTGTTEGAAAELREIFSRTIAAHEEGLVLKADEARYNERKLPWVKLKKDYIPGHGDALDLVLVGAAWEAGRARELQVPTTAYTTFYLGALANSNVLKANATTPPHFEVFFTACYGLTREQLEELNFMIKSSDPIECSQYPNGLSYTCSLFRGIPQPAVLLRQPILAEVFGASFTKAPLSLHYEIRFPRISKVFRLSERSWTEGTTLEEFQRVAREAVGRDRPNKDVDDWANGLWGKPSSPGARCAVKRKRTEDDWAARLALVDQKENERMARRVEREGRAGGLGRAPRRGKERENAGVGAHDGPRLRTLGSMTNIAGSSGSSRVRSPLPELSQARSDHVVHELSGPGRKPLDLDDMVDGSPLESSTPEDQIPGSVLHRSSAPTARDLDSSDVFFSGDEIGVPGQPPSPAAERMEFEHALEFAAATPSEDYSDVSSTSMANFLTNTVVWLARPCDTPRPSWRAPSHQVIPAGQQVHGLEAFLQACGWSASEPAANCGWVERGVVFVDDSNDRADGKQWMDYPLKTLSERRVNLIRQGEVTRCKPVWLLSMTMLSIGKLGKPVDEIEQRVICRFG